MRRALAVIAAVSGVLASPSARADSWDFCESFSFLVENDVFVPSGNDRHYTNGVRASCLSAPDRIPDWGDWLARNLPFIAYNGKKRIGYAIGQNMYTPEDIGDPAPQPDDRPWAGWLYGEVSIVSETDRRLDSAALTFGMVGPWSGAEWAQKRWHELIYASEPKGWDNQLDNEPAINLTVDRQWRYYALPDIAGLNADFTPHLGGALGNVYTYAAAGVTARFGSGLDKDFGGPPRIRPSLPGAAHFEAKESCSEYFCGWYGFAGVEGRAVLRNIFLDGNTFGGGPSVDRKLFVGDLQAGAALLFRRFRLTYTIVFRTREFDGQDDGDIFGAFSATTRF